MVKGLAQPDHSKACIDDPKLVSYYEPTGYRRIPLTNCEGGQELEKWESKEHPCKGHEKDYEEKHRGLSGFWLFVVAVLIPAGVGTAVGYWVWTNWDVKFGQIRLGTDGTSVQQSWLTYPIMAIAAVVAGLAAVPLILSSLWRSVSALFGGGDGGSSSGGRRYTTRSSFARGRGDYAVVDPDEDELLGDDEDEDV